MPPPDAVPLVIPDWPLPPGVRCCVTTRHGRGSEGPYAGFNLATHVGDDASAVAVNRRTLAATLGLSGEPLWLHQVHGASVVDACRVSRHEVPVADGAVAFAPGAVCVVLTADCVPVVLAARNGAAVAALHAGWRGVAAGILDAGVAALASVGALEAWVGPAISATHYEVGDDVRTALLSADPRFARRFQSAGRDHWMADLPGMVHDRLRELGVASVTLSALCSFADSRFYSYRRDTVTGRNATLVWLE